MPFGLGKRQCLGEPLARAELLMIFVSCVQRFTFAAVGDQPPPTLTPVFGATSCPAVYKMRVAKNVM